MEYLFVMFILIVLVYLFKEDIKNDEVLTKMLLTLFIVSGLAGLIFVLFIKYIWK